jgi:hypothetical protein
MYDQARRDRKTKHSHNHKDAHKKHSLSGRKSLKQEQTYAILYLDPNSPSFPTQSQFLHPNLSDNWFSPFYFSFFVGGEGRGGRVCFQRSVIQNLSLPSSLSSLHRPFLLPWNNLFSSFPQFPTIEKQQRITNNDDNNNGNDGAMGDGKS